MCNIKRNDSNELKNKRKTDAQRKKDKREIWATVLIKTMKVCQLAQVCTLADNKIISGPVM